MTTNAIDHDTFVALRDTTGAEFVRELIDTFLQEAPGMLGDLRESLASDDADRFRRAAHSLKSNGNTFGARAFAAMAKELELGGMAPVRSAGGAPLAALEDEYKRVAQALTELKGE
jgi:HPt (histidine-containing phosphotransfer) domain-containing protein